MTNYSTQTITNAIIKALEAGTIPWRKPWSSLTPQNFTTRKPYHGINYFLLSLFPADVPLYLTYNQARKLGGGIKAANNRKYDAMPICFFEWIKKDKNSPEDEEEDSKAEYYPMYKSFLVYNIEDTYGIDYSKATEELHHNNAKLPEAETVLSGYKDCPPITYQGNQAYYRPSADTLTLPPLERFTTSNEYYSTLFHELTHSTGAEKRLNRKGITDTARFGSEPYAKEELIAEMGSAFLCARCGIDNTLQNSTAYIQGWLKALKNDSRLVITAAGQAEKAANYILGIKAGE